MNALTFKKLLEKIEKIDKLDLEPKDSEYDFDYAQKIIEKNFKNNQKEDEILSEIQENNNEN